MRAARITLLTTVFGCLSLGTGPEAQAAEYALSTYALGQNGFGAGVTPPAGLYMSTIGGSTLPVSGGPSSLAVCL
jgi:hypothetical protein